ncbi:MAG TPA: phage holin family protein [Candidatus Binatia bacterium]|jgi:putative membrane protein|nr:phage holin family protein [Candidatus Binatia bacterium]
MQFLLQWVLNALGLLIVAHIVPGFHVQSFAAALIASIVIGLVNAAVGWLLILLTLPLTVLTFGLFLLVVNALLIWMASGLSPGFHIDGFGAAMLGALVLAVVNSILRALVSA